MHYDKAKATVIPFGPNKGRTIGDIGSDSKGLRSLDDLLSKPWFQRMADLKEAVETYLNDPNVRHRWDDAVNG